MQGRQQEKISKMTSNNDIRQERQHLTAVWQKWRCRFAETFVQICKFITRPNSSEPPPTPSRGTLPTSLKKTTQRTICYLKTEKEKRNNEQPMHKTTSRLKSGQKSCFSCRRTTVN